MSKAASKGPSLPRVRFTDGYQPPPGPKPPLPKVGSAVKPPAVRIEANAKDR